MTQVARPVEDTHYPVPPPNGSEQDSWRNENGEIGSGDLDPENDEGELFFTFALFESINTFLPNDLTFAEAGALLGTELPQEIVSYVTRLSVVDSPETSDQGLTIRARLAKNIGEGNRVRCLVELREEYNNEETDLGILIASAEFVDLPETFQEYSFVATPAQAANITDFNELYLRFVFTYDT